MSHSSKQTEDTKYDVQDPEAAECETSGQCQETNGDSYEHVVDVQLEPVHPIANDGFFVRIASAFGYCYRGEPLTDQGKRVQLVKVLSLTLLPILGLWVFTVHSLNDSIEGKFAIEQTQSAVKFSVEIGIFLDRIQRERDMSVLYLSILGPETKTFLLNEYILTDEALEHLSRWPVINEFNTVLRSKQSFQNYLKDHRNKLDPNDFNIYATMNFYNGLIERFVEWMYGSIRESSMASIWKVLVAYQKIVTGMEHIGVERALGTVFYVEGGLQQTWYKSYNNRVNIYKANYRSAVLYSHIVDPIFQQGVTSSGTNLTTVIESFRFEIQHSKFVEASITKGQWWFDNMTMYLDRLLLIQQELATFINGELQNIIDEEENNLTISACFLVFVFFMCPLVIYSVEALTSDIQKYAIAMNNKTKELATEKEKIDTLLYQMVPAAVADRLKRNQAADAEYFKSVTVLFFDIDGFVLILKESTPLEIIDLLNTLYTEIDIELDNHEVYKVETINDSYMVASGLPTRNGQRHSAAIANLALTLVDMMIQRKFKAGRQHLIKLRIGIDTGPCTAGTVGRVLPRYCLFGDTINTASRMKSHSLPDKIHLSSNAASSLKRHRVFVLQYRGTIEVKGKGKMKTFWLMRKMEKKEDKQVLETSCSLDTAASESLAGDAMKQMPVGEIEKYVPNNVWTNRYYYTQDNASSIDSLTDEGLSSIFVTLSTEARHAMPMDRRGAVPTAREAWLSNSTGKSGKKRWDGRKHSLKRRLLSGSYADKVHENIHEYNEASIHDEGKGGEHPATAEDDAAAAATSHAQAKSAAPNKLAAANNEEMPKANTSSQSAPAAAEKEGKATKTAVQAFSVDNIDTDVSETDYHPLREGGGSGGETVPTTTAALTVTNTTTSAETSVTDTGNSAERDPGGTYYSRASSFESELVTSKSSSSMPKEAEMRKASWPESQKEAISNQLNLTLKPAQSHSCSNITVSGAGSQARLHWETQQSDWFWHYSQPYASNNHDFPASVAIGPQALPEAPGTAAAGEKCEADAIVVDTLNASPTSSRQWLNPTPANSPTPSSAGKKSSLQMSSAPPDVDFPTKEDRKVDAALTSAAGAGEPGVRPVPDEAGNSAGCPAPHNAPNTSSPPIVSTPGRPASATVSQDSSESQLASTAAAESALAHVATAGSLKAVTEQSTFTPQIQEELISRAPPGAQQAKAIILTAKNQRDAALGGRQAAEGTQQTGFSTPVTQQPKSEVLQNTCSSSQAVANTPGSPQAMATTPESQKAMVNTLGSQQAMVAAPGSGQALVTTPGSEETIVTTAGSQQATAETPHSQAAKVETPESQAATVKQPEAQAALVKKPEDQEATIALHEGKEVITNSGSQEAKVTNPRLHQAMATTTGTQQAAFSAAESQHIMTTDPESQDAATLEAQPAASEAPATVPTTDQDAADPEFRKVIVTRTVSTPHPSSPRMSRLGSGKAGNSTPSPLKRRSESCSGRGRGIRGAGTFPTSKSKPATGAAPHCCTSKQPAGGVLANSPKGSAVTKQVINQAGVSSSPVVPLPAACSEPFSVSSAVPATGFNDSALGPTTAKVVGNGPPDVACVNSSSGSLPPSSTGVNRPDVIVSSPGNDDVILVGDVAKTRQALHDSKA